MEKYRNLLALSYFKEQKERYSISELMLLLGLNNYQISELMEYLIQNNYISFDDNNLIYLTSKGMVFLISNDCDEMVFQSDVELEHINPQRSIPLDKPYVPKDFQNKYNG